jgi:chromosome segregation ATPase
LRAAEKRALLEIERERGVSARSQKELEAAARRAEQSETRHREEMQALQVQLGDARHRAGVVEGNLEALRSSNAAHARELDALRLQLTTAVANQAATRSRPLSSVETNKPRRTAPKVATRKRSAS